MRTAIAILLMFALATSADAQIWRDRLQNGKCGCCGREYEDVRYVPKRALPDTTMTVRGYVYRIVPMPPDSSVIRRGNRLWKLVHEAAKP